MHRWKKGNGTLFFGTCMMLIASFFCIMFVQIFIIRQNAIDMQTTVDSIADGTAVYMVNEGGDFEDAEAKAKEISKLIKNKIGIDSKNLELDEEAFDESKIGVTAAIKNYYISSLHSQGSDKYKIFKNAITEFLGGGLEGFPGVLKWLEDSIPYAHYSNVGRDSLTPEGYIRQTDCSGMCWLAYRKMGCTAPMWYTGSMIDVYFYRIPESQLQPGDCIVKKGSPMGHAMLYVGDGKCFEMGGISAIRGTAMGYRDMPDIGSFESGDGEYHCYRIKPEYME